MRSTVFSVALVGALLVGAVGEQAHCEIPCGIYGDEARFVEMREHVRTIEKSMKQIAALSEKTPADYNQIVRWVANKDAHAVKLQEVVWQYFLAQRVKPAGPKDDEAHRAAYGLQLELLHRISLRAMKAKRGTDVAHVTALKTLIDRFEKAYFGR